MLIKFDRPIDVDIFLEVDIMVDENFPADGFDQIKQEILDFVDITFSIADEVVSTKLFEPIHNVSGITDVALRLATSNLALIQTLEMDSDFVAANIINLDIAGSPIAEQFFVSDQATTMTNLAAAIAAAPEIATAVVT